MHDGSFLSDLGLVALVAALTGTLARRFKQPSILGYLLAGLILGPYVAIPLSVDPVRIDEIAEFGLVFVLFTIGLEFRIGRLFQILPTAGFTALVQMATMMWLGATIANMLGWSAAGGLCLGAALAMSSTMVVSAVLGQKPVDDDVKDHVMGVLVVQDVGSIVLMTIVTAAAQGAEVETASVVSIVAKLVTVVLGLLVLGTLLARWLVPRVQRYAGPDGLAVVSVGLAFGFASVAEWFGYSVALGAFVAGMAVAESGRAAAVEVAVDSLRAVFAAIFFVSIGMSVDPNIAMTNLPLALGLSLVVIVGQWASITVASVLSGASLRRAVFSGLLLGQVGEMSFILAGIGSEGGIVPKTALPVLVTAAALTTFTTPWMLARGEKITRLVDNTLPGPVHHVLSVHQAFMERLRQGELGRFLPPSLVALVLDWSALVVLGVARAIIGSKLDRWLSPTVLTIITILIAVPFIVGLIRSGRAAMVQVHNLVHDAIPHGETAKILEGVAYLTAAVGVGLPTLAVLGPLVGNSIIALALLCLLVVIAILIGRRVGHYDTSYTSGVARIVQRLAMSSGELAAQVVPAGQQAGVIEPSGFQITGVDNVAVSLPPLAPSVGKSLADLNLRCLSGGATVVAIRRDNREIVLPSAQEKLAPHDVLVVSGASEAVHKARRLLLGGTLPLPHELGPAFG